MADDKKNGGSKDINHGDDCMCSTCNGVMGKMCNCGCRHGGHWTFFLLRALITIIILMIVFAFGAAVGRMTSDFNGRYQIMRYGYGGYPAGMYNAGGGMAVPGATGMPMMRINGATSTPATGAVGGVQNY
jgi:hypothetical protein